MEGDLLTAAVEPIRKNFNPLPPHGGRPKDDKKAAKALIISIHSLRMEGDRSFASSRSSLRISIHSLRMEGDLFGLLPDFLFLAFQSTPSAWRETIRY